MRAGGEFGFRIPKNQDSKANAKVYHDAPDVQEPIWGLKRRVRQGRRRPEHGGRWASLDKPGILYTLGALETDAR